MLCACCFKDLSAVELYSSPLHGACAKGDIEEVGRIVSGDKHMRPNDQGETILMWAAEHGRILLMREIIRQYIATATPGEGGDGQWLSSDGSVSIGWDINSLDNKGNTVLGRVIASSKLSDGQRLSVVKELLSIHVKYPAAGCVGVLDVNFGRTPPCIIALRKRDTAVANLLLGLRANLIQKEVETGETALLAAVKMRLVNQVDVLLKHPSLQGAKDEIRAAYDFANLSADSPEYTKADRRQFRNIATLLQSHVTQDVASRHQSVPQPLNPEGVRSSVAVQNPLAVAAALAQVSSWHDVGAPKIGRWLG